MCYRLFHCNYQRFCGKSFCIVGDNTILVYTLHRDGICSILYIISSLYTIIRPGGEAQKGKGRRGGNPQQEAIGSAAKAGRIKSKGSIFSTLPFLI